MTHWFIRLAALVFSVAVLATAYSANAAELKVLATGAHIDSFKEIVPLFERASGHKLTVKYDATPVQISATAMAASSARRRPMDIGCLPSGSSFS